MVPEGGERGAREAPRIVAYARARAHVPSLSRASQLCAAARAVRGGARGRAAHALLEGAAPERASAL